MCRAIVKNEPGEHPFVPENFMSPAIGRFVRSMSPAVGRFVRRGLKVPRLLAEGFWDMIAHPIDSSLFEPMTRLSRALPVGVFRNEPIRAYLEKIFSMHGRTDDFRELRRKLVLVATDHDCGRSVRFGDPGLDHAPISTAVQASTALPAVDTFRSVELGVMRRGQLVDRGLPTVLAQTFRTMVHSRMGAGLAAYETRYADRDVLVFEPRRDDYDMFFTNVFSFSNRKAVCEHAYNSTRRKLWRNRTRIEPILARHELRLRTADLEDQDRDLWKSVRLHERRPRSRSPVTQRLEKTLAKIESMVAEQTV